MHRRAWLFEQGYRSAQPAPGWRRCASWARPCCGWLIPIADLAQPDPSGRACRGRRRGLGRRSSSCLPRRGRGWPVTHEDIARVLMRAGRGAGAGDRADARARAVASRCCSSALPSAGGHAAAAAPRRSPRSSARTVLRGRDACALGGATDGHDRLVGRHHAGASGSCSWPSAGSSAPTSSCARRAPSSPQLRGGRGAPALRARPARPARPQPVGDRAEGRARRAAAARPTPSGREREVADDPGRHARGAGRGARGGQRLPPADARGRAGGRADGARGRRDRGRARDAGASRSRPRSRRCSPGRCARGRRT